MGGTSEQPDGDGRRNRLEGIGIQLTEPTTEQDLSEAEEEIASAFSFPDLPTVEQQIRAIEAPIQARYADEIALDSEVVDEILRTGSNRSKGQLRLIYNFMVEKTPEEYTEFVKNEYGTGGKGFEIGGAKYAVWFDDLGLRIAAGSTARGGTIANAFLSWEDVGNRIHELLRQGEYAELQSLLTADEYKEARASTLNAFYTSPTVIKAMYEALGNMGLSKGNVLEPSCGVGNFMGLVPDSMEKIRMYGVELDSISGRIAQQLYQKNKIAVQGFETMQFPDSFFDCVVGNVPFGNYKVPDKRYDRHNFLIHDYFIAKSLDLVRPGGVVAVVTSSGTMDKKDSSVREYLANRADLVGAIRLPNNAFQRNANTGVVADILFLQKRDRAAVERADWVDLGETPEGYSINQYFAQHPEMVLGEITTESTQYGKQETTVKPIEGADLAGQLKEAVGNIQATITEPEISDDELDVQEEPIPADPSVKNFSFTNVDGQI
jgi:type I restriction-modification system DNA methylase subunit